MSSLYDRFVHKYSRLPTEFDPDYLEMLRMSKYRVIDVPDVSPGKCANCGASKNDGRRYIDFGLHVDWYGAVFLCTSCLTDAAIHAGLFEEMEKRLQESVDAQNKIEELKKKGENLHETVVTLFKELEDYYANLHPLGMDSSSDSNPDMVVEEPAVESGTNSPKPRVTKPSTGSGSKNIPSLADLINDSK